MRFTLPLLGLGLCMPHMMQGQHLRIGTSSSFSDDTWNDILRLHVYFDAPEGVEDSMITVIWDEQTETWMNQDRATFDWSDPDAIYVLEELWNSGLSVWELHERNTTVLNGGQPVTHLVEYFDGIAWQPLENVLYTYNGEGQRVEYLEQAWTGSDWADRRRRVYVYDDLENRIVDRLDTLGVEWITTEVDSFSFDGNGLEIEKARWTLVDDEFVHTNHHFYTYDDQDQLIAEDISTEFFGMGLIPMQHIEYEAAGDGLTDHHGHFNVAPLGEPVWEYAWRMLWSDPISTTVPMEAQERLTVYPNPAMGAFYVELPEHTPADAMLVLRDPLGRKVHEQLARPGTNTLDVQLPPGAYLITTSSLAYTTRIIIR